MKHSPLLIFFVFFFTADIVSAQILNDSSQSIYGTKTTRIFYENDYLLGKYEKGFVDTTLNNMNQYRHWFRDSTFQQDLGNIGTASKPILWRLPERIGARLGRDAFSRYKYDPLSIAYFDTKSPYTHLHYIQGSLGEQVFEAKHSRSIKETANIGFSFQRLAGNKQIGLGPRNDESQVDNLGFVLFTHIQNKKANYHVFANFSKFKHSQIESGGIRVSLTAPDDSLFQYSDSPVRLTNAVSREEGNNLHLTHFYNLAKEYIKIFHISDFRHQYNKYTDADLEYTSSGATRNLSFYPTTFIDANQTEDYSIYREWENTVGITGNHPLFFYKLYAKRRDAGASFKTRSSIIDPVDSTRANFVINRNFGQNFLGGETQFRLKDIFNITAVAEYQLFDDYKATASARVKFLTVSQTRSSYSPTLMQQFYTSNHYAWKNEFENIIADRTAANINLRLFNHHLRAEIARTNLQNYVIYDSLFSNPKQLSKQLSFFTAYVQHQFHIRSIYFDHVLSVNNTSNAEEIRMPDWIVNSKIYFQGSLFKDALFGQLGVETYISDNYFADAYNPTLQQFYLQNRFRVSNPRANTLYPVVDIFLNADIKSFNVFLKMAHVNQGFPNNGYFSTPYYPGLQRSFVFGIKWMFFD